MLSTLIINKIVDSKLEKAEETATVVRMDNRTLSRIEAAKNAGKASAQESRDKKAKDDEEDKEALVVSAKEELAGIEQGNIFDAPQAIEETEPTEE